MMKRRRVRVMKRRKRSGSEVLGGLAPVRAAGGLL